jgi:histidinol-phosphate aminotransferase
MSSQIRPRPAIARIGPERGLREGRARFLRLDYNENTVGCTPAALAAVRRFTRAQVAMYPEYERTRRRLARHFRVAPEELALTNGVDDALRLVVDTFVEAGARVLVVDPTFPMYHFWTALAGGRLVRLRYNAAMRFPLEAVLRELRRHPRVFFLANPNNPTGTLLSADDIRTVLDAATHTLVVVDEAYVEFSGVTVLPWIRQYENLVVTRTFSKVAGLAGLRMGCLLARRDLIREFRKAQPPFPVNSVALAAAEAAIRDRKCLRAHVREILRARRELENALNRLGVRYVPSAGSFVLANFGPDAPRLLRRLRRLGILLRDRSAEFGRVGFVRITVGTRAQMSRLIRELKDLI